MVGKGEGHAYPIRVDKCPLVREEADYHGGIGLEAAPNADGEYNPLVPSR